MARRRKKGPDILEIALACGSLVGLVSIVNPQIRNAIVQFGAFVLWIVIFLVITALLLAIASVIKSTKQTPAEVAGHKNETLEPPTSKPPGKDDSRYMPKQSAPCQQDDSRYMPKEMVATRDVEPCMREPQKSLAHQLHSIDWFQFEKLIALAYSKTHKVTRRGGANPDGGIDLILENAEGHTAIQCKQWRSWKVGVRNVRELIGAMTVEGLKKGMIVTIKGYSQDAADLAHRHGIDLVDEDGVSELLRLADQSAVETILQDERKFCPKCEREMVLRTATKGFNAGGQFWGCSGYPRCRVVMKVSEVPHSKVEDTFDSLQRQNFSSVGSVGFEEGMKT